MTDNNLTDLMMTLDLPNTTWIDADNMSLPDNMTDEPFYCSWCLPEGLTTPEYLLYNFIVVGLAMPLIGLCGLVGNTLSAFVYSRRNMRSSANLYLCALAISDILVIITGLFLFSVDNLRKHSWQVEIFYGKLAPFLYPLGLTAQTCSVYFTVVAGIDCFFELLTPHTIKQRVCSVRMAYRAITFVSVFSIGYNVPHVYELEVLSCYSQRWEGESLAVCPTEFRLDPAYMEIYYQYLYTIFMAGGPLILLIILNGVIVTASFVKSKKRRNQTSAAVVGPKITVTQAGSLDIDDNLCEAPPPTYIETVLMTSGAYATHTVSTADEDDVALDDEQPADTVTLILVVALFIFCNSLALIINFLESSFNEELGTALNYMVDISNLLVVCNSSANFIIYYAFGQHFRLTLQWYMCHKSPPNSVAGTASPRMNVSTGANGVQTQDDKMRCRLAGAASNGSVDTENMDVVSGHALTTAGYAPMRQARVLYMDEQSSGEYTERIYC